MVKLILTFVLGLIVGWNFVSQPAFIKAGVDKLVGLVKGLFGKFKK